jgi:hypothetical protein
MIQQSQRNRRSGSSADSQPVKKFNAGLRVVQGFRNAIAASGTTTVTLSLLSAGRKLLGITMVPSTGTLVTLADTQVTLIVNNFNLIIGMSANNLNPNFVGNMIFFPCPQILKGNDSISLSILKNDAGAAVATINLFYVPQM